MKRLVLFCLFSLLIHTSVKSQCSEIVYALPKNVQDIILSEIQLDLKFYDTTEHKLYILLYEQCDTLICSIQRTSKNTLEGRRGNILSITKMSNRYVILNKDYKLPVIFYFDLMFSQWSSGLNSRSYRIKFNYSGKVYGARFE